MPVRSRLIRAHNDLHRIRQCWHGHLGREKEAEYCRAQGPHRTRPDRSISGASTESPFPLALRPDPARPKPVPLGLLPPPRRQRRRPQVPRQEHRPGLDHGPRPDARRAQVHVPVRHGAHRRRAARARGRAGRHNAHLRRRPERHSGCDVPRLAVPRAGLIGAAGPRALPGLGGVGGRMHRVRESVPAGGSGQRAAASGCGVGRGLVARQTGMDVPDGNGDNRTLVRLTLAQISTALSKGGGA